MTVLVIVIALVGLIYGLWKYQQYREYQRFLSGTYDLETKTKEFEQHPSLNLCIYLIDRYHTKKEYDKAIHYAEKCINDLHSDTTLAGWYIQILLASLQSEVGNKQEAVFHLKRALELDKSRRIEQGKFIDGLGLSEVYKQLKTDQGP